MNAAEHRAKGRWLGLAAGAAAVALLVVGLLSREWLRGTDFGIETHLGLRELELCQEVETDPGRHTSSCTIMAVDALSHDAVTPVGFARFRTLCAVSTWTGVAAAGLLTLCLVLSLVGRPIDLPIHPTTFAILASFAALAAAGLTLALNPYTALTGWGSGRGFVFFGLGAGLSMFASILLGRARPRPLDDF